MTTHDTPQPGPARATLTVGERTYEYFPLAAAGSGDLDACRTPSRSCSRTCCAVPRRSPTSCGADDVRALASWDPTGPGEAELPFMPARVILQDFTGVPCVVDLAAMRDAWPRWAATRLGSIRSCRPTS